MSVISDRHTGGGGIAGHGNIYDRAYIIIAMTLSAAAGAWYELPGSFMIFTLSLARAQARQVRFFFRSMLSGLLPNAHEWRPASVMEVMTSIYPSTAVTTHLTAETRPVVFLPESCEPFGMSCLSSQDHVASSAFVPTQVELGPAKDDSHSCIVHLTRQGVLMKHHQIKSFAPI
jgi:hypothetical protein